MVWRVVWVVGRARMWVGWRMVWACVRVGLWACVSVILWAYEVWEMQRWGVVADDGYGGVGCRAWSVGLEV